MKRNPEEIQLLQEWLHYARENLLYARAGLKEDFSPFNTICFLCQSSAEEYLKGYLVFNGWELEKTHDLAKLLGYAVDYDKDFTMLKPFAKTLNEYISEVRYPGDLAFHSFTEKKAREAVEAAEQIEAFILEKIGPLDELESANHNDA